MSTKVENVLGDNKLDAIVCVAGGWAGGNAASNGMSVKNFINQLLTNFVFYSVDYVKSCDLMWKQSVWTSVLASQIAAKHLNRCPQL